MITHPSHQPVSALRERMIEDMSVRGFTEKTRHDYIRCVKTLAVFIGHLYPVFHRFRGGKGIATAAGIVFALHWPLGLLLAVIWLTMAFGFKIRSVAGLTVAVLMPLGMFYVRGADPIALAMLPIAALLFWRHRENIRELVSGSERTIGR